MSKPEANKTELEERLDYVIKKLEEYKLKKCKPHATKINVSKKVFKKVYVALEKLQTAYPILPVKKAQVKKYTKLQERTITNAFLLLCKLKLLIQDGRGKYWLPCFYCNRVDNLITELVNEKTKSFVGKYILEALPYCKSDEDYELLYKFLDKMRENKEEQEKEMDYEARQEWLENAQRESEEMEKSS